MKKPKCGVWNGRIVGLSSEIADGMACVILQAFADDSENEGSYIVAGYVASLDAWANITPRWYEVLKWPPRLGHYRTSDAIALKSEFKHFNERSRNERIAALANVISSGGCLGVASCVSKAEAREFWSPGFHPGWRDPYYLCAINLIQRLCFALSRTRGLTKIDFIFDRQGKVGQQFRAVYDMALKPMSLGRFPFMGEVRFENKREFLPLQAADMQAGWVRRVTSPIQVWTSADVYLSKIPQLSYPITREFLKYLKDYARSHSTEMDAFRAFIESVLK